MSAAMLFAEPVAYVPDTRSTAPAPGAPLAGCSIYVYAAGTSTPQTVYQDVALSIPWSQPIVTNSAGQSNGSIFVSPTPSLKIQILDPTNIPMPGWPIDNWSPYALTT